MSTDSSVIVHDQMDIHELFAAARAAMLLPEGAQWKLHDNGATHMLLTRPQVGYPRVSVHFEPNGGLYPTGPEDDQPDGYAVVGLSHSPSDSAARSEQLAGIDRLGRYLTSVNRTWSWQFEDEGWNVGATAAKPDRASDSDATGGQSRTSH